MAAAGTMEGLIVSALRHHRPQPFLIHHKCRVRKLGGGLGCALGIEGIV